MWNEVRKAMSGMFLGKPIEDLHPKDKELLKTERAQAEFERLSEEDKQRIRDTIEKWNRFEARWRAEEDAVVEIGTALIRAKQDGKAEAYKEVALGAPRAAINLSQQRPEEAKRAWNDAALLERFWADKSDISDKTKDKSYGQAFREFSDRIGNKPIAEIHRSDIKAFAEYLRDRPSSRGGVLDQGTIGRLLSHIRTLFAWYVEAGFLEANPAQGVVARAAPKLDDDEDAEDADGEKRRAFTDAELKTLFSSPLFKGCKSSSRLTQTGNVVLRNERYWFWVIALLTGARTTEIARASATLVRVGDVDCIDFRKATKTKASPRLVPVLPELKELGFMEWAASQEKQGRKLVEGPNAPKVWTKWTNYYLNRIGLDDEDVAPYSLRHVFRQQLRAADLHPEIVDKVFGHKGQTVGAGYGRHLSADEAKRVVERVKSPIPLEHLWR
jgi:integrase